MIMKTTIIKDGGGNDKDGSDMVLLVEIEEGRKEMKNERKMGKS